jgi:subtilisin family serine protease
MKLAFATATVIMMLCAAFGDASKSHRVHPLEGFKEALSNPNLILLKREVIDTRARMDLDIAAADQAASQTASALSNYSSKQMRLVQLAGPIKRNQLDQILATGVEVIGYIPNYAYIIRGDARQLALCAGLDAGPLADDSRPIRWMARFDPVWKIAPDFDDALLRAGESISVDVEIELLARAETTRTLEQIARLAKINLGPRSFLDFTVISATVPSNRLLTLAGFEEVLFITRASQAQLADERSAQIVAGNLTADRMRPVSPGYLDWLESKGLTNSPDFVIDFCDTGLDNGSTDFKSVHPDFLDSNGLSRVVYNTNYADDGQSDDRRGHGTIVAAVACGYKTSGLTDQAGYLFGLGVAPTFKLGASRIFRADGRLPTRISFTSVASSAYAQGARISNNSWGQSGNDYNSVSQEYDALVRDAQPSVAGNQEMVFVFSAGNNGAGGHISSPGTAKNVITVAASENYRPEGVDSCDLDGRGPVGPDGADSALDILRFSSGGPTNDGRAKPDLAAPGTHIYGAASRSPFFFADGLCPGRPIFQPPGQTLYTWSSGTSMAAPHVAGAAALVRMFFVAHNLLDGARPPSPAMIKAYLVNSATYLTGENAGGDLPAPRQGWGLLCLSRAFDDTKRILIDQTKLFTESGQKFEIRGSLDDTKRPLRVTLAWTDAPASLAGAAWVNDLDLEVTIGGVTYYGNNFAGEFSVAGGTPDRRNNVESIFLPPEAIPQGANGNFTITVRAWNVAGDGVPGNGINLDQDFALVVYNIAPPIEPPPPPIPVITAASYAKKVLTITGRDFTAAARVEINGQIVNQQFSFDAAANSLSIKMKASKLNLRSDADNQIVLIEAGRRSLPFLLRL